MQYALTFAALAAPALVAAHGQIKSPAPRVAGAALAKTCGEQIKNQMASDPFGNIQGELQNAGQNGVGADCNLWLCKGFQFADNDAANVQSYSVGEEVPIEFDVRAPHTGTANVSIVDTATNTIIGEPLITWDEYASNSAQIPKDQLSFSIKIPDLGTKCAKAGACVIQHYWDARSIDQTYESCIDFTVSGGSGGGSAPAPAPSSAAPATSTKEAVAAPTATDAAGADDEDDECDADAAGDDDDEDDECDADAGDDEAAPAPTTLVTSTRPAATPAPGGSSGAAALYAQCGGQGFTGPTSCSEGTCKEMNPYYSQCVN